MLAIALSPLVLPMTAWMQLRQILAGNGLLL